MSVVLRPARSADARRATMLLTLAAGEGAQLTPAAVPVALMPTNGREPQVGVIREGDGCYAEYRDCVDRVVQRGFARFPA